MTTPSTERERLGRLLSRAAEQAARIFPSDSALQSLLRELDQAMHDHERCSDSQVEQILTARTADELRSLVVELSSDAGAQASPEQLTEVTELLAAVVLIEGTSLGTPKARRIREMTSPADLVTVERLSALLEHADAALTSGLSPASPDQAAAPPQDDAVRSDLEEALRLVDRAQREMQVQQQNLTDLRARLERLRDQMAGEREYSPQVRPKRPDMPSGVYSTILATDIQGFSSPERTEDDRRVLRDSMYTMLEQAFDAIGIGFSDLYQEDRGDGALLVIPPDISTAAVIDPFAAYLASALRRHNRRAAQPVRMQLRLAVHAGFIHPDGQGLSGSALITTFRLLDAPMVKQRIAETNADLGLVVSAMVFDAVIEPASRTAGSDLYSFIPIEMKESQMSAWMRVFGGPQARQVPGAPARARQAQPAVGLAAPLSSTVAPPVLATETSLAQALTAAFAEGQSFGRQIAQDAPALWLEAVLARKPRMPSDLESRLLQQSAIPIDSLLHDEVRQALRRGFWDALEHATSS